MSSALDRLIPLLALEQIEVNLFLGRSPPEPRGRIFGGQVVAQALTAAYRTVQERICHSLQSYFIRPGDPTIPVLYQVEHSRDGKSFTTRRVIAIQRGEQIFNMACSFQVPEDGVEHQNDMPDAPGPDTLKDDREHWLEDFKDLPEWQKRGDWDRPIDLRPVNPVSLRKPELAPPHHMVWMRAAGALPADDMQLHQSLLAFASDYSLLGTSLRPHGKNWMTQVQTASLDHIMWFHRPTDFSRWHLYVMDSPSASGARGFNRGSIYRDDGVLVASAAQEGLIRPRP
ncbi:MAG: acyl-CoA thioesterase II [Hyphomonadaceae bacterium]|nr:acyl-CoA thioesterase II [Hyphomonadaceae bacterium]